MAITTSNSTSVNAQAFVNVRMLSCDAPVNLTAVRFGLRDHFIDCFPLGNAIVLTSEINKVSLDFCERRTNSTQRDTIVRIRLVPL
jgi:hypothetical protein